LHLAPEPLVRIFYPLCGLDRRRDVYRIAVWYWELEQVPPEWKRHARLLNEIWAPTRFIADAMRAVMPIPVVHMLPGVELKRFTPRPRSHFGLPEDRFLFLFVFDMFSVMERKNPLGLITAFRRAFRTGERASLIIKVSRAEADPAGWQRLQEEARRAGVFLINEILPRDEVSALMQACDCYVSLHRSEGFGLTMAEAMLLGKPVIATAYSGNLDFMSPDNSRLVSCRRVPITRELPFYRKGCLWADPDLEQAAHWMRWVYDHAEEARALGQRGRADVSRLLSFRSAGERMARRLQELKGASRLSPHSDRAA
jgi:glycosyltransferase involved in cell wall biosynthesis